jgi:hypothetical protein
MTHITAKEIKVKETTQKILFQTELILMHRQALIDRLQQLNEKHNTLKQLNENKLQNRRSYFK